MPLKVIAFDINGSMNSENSCKTFIYEGWNFNNGNTAVETPCNGTK
jgi:hypothetical protein